MSRMIFWDNDGVLVDTEPFFFRATAETLAEHGVTLTEATFRDVSLTQGRSVFDLLGKSVDEPTRIRLRDRRNDRFTDYLRQGGHLIAGAAEVLEQLAEHHRMAVVTSCRREHFDVVHTDTHIRHRFEFILTLNDYPRTKPHPDPYLAALQRANVAATDAVVVEDSPRGVQAAVAAGIACIAVPRGLTRDADFTGAAFVLDALAQVPAALERLEMGHSG